jgi:hypothetical protein
MDNEKDFVVLNNATINLYNNNAVITSHVDKYSLSYLTHKYQQYFNQTGLIQSKKNIQSMCILSDKFNIILYSSIIERLEFEDEYTSKINIIYDNMEFFFESNTYMRRIKIEKIMENINRGR